VTLFVPERAESPLYRIYGLLDAAFKEEIFLRIKPAVRPGRGGSYAISALQDSKGDSCSMAAVSLPAFFLMSAGWDRLYDAGEIYPFAVIGAIPNALWVDERSPLRTLEDFLAWARRETVLRGKRLDVAGTGRFTDQHLASLQLGRATGLRIGYLPLLGAAESAESAKSGPAAACWGPAYPLREMPGLRPLAVAAAKRSPALPNVPTFLESGCAVQNLVWLCLALPASTPEAIREKSRAEAAKVLKNPALRQKLAAFGLTLPGESEDLERIMDHQKETALKLIRDYALIPKEEIPPKAAW
jgi:tripartite-type tricarboxylate transporter receptor subunit TctC